MKPAVSASHRQLALVDALVLEAANKPTDASMAAQHDADGWPAMQPR